MGIAWGRSILYFLIVAAIGLGLSFFTDAKRDSSGNVVESGTQTFSQLQVGDCIERTNSDGPDPVPSSQGDYSFNVVPCDQPHIWEVFGLESISDSDYSEAAITQQSELHCTDEFSSYVGVDYSFSSLTFQWYQPTKETWSDGDRLITCLVASGDKSMRTGSLRNYNG